MKTKYNASFYRGLGGRGKYSSPPLLSPPFLPDSGRIRGVVTRQRDRPVVLIYLVLKLGGLVKGGSLFSEGSHRRGTTHCVPASNSGSNGTKREKISYERNYYMTTIRQCDASYQFGCSASSSA